MRLLIVTNLYPPQELGGYGRSMADFAWGLAKRGHQISVVTSHAPYLSADPEANLISGPSGEFVDRRLRLKGSYERGLQIISDLATCSAIDSENLSVIRDALSKPLDGILVGNVDLLGPEVLFCLSKSRFLFEKKKRLDAEGLCYVRREWSNGDCN